MGEGLFLEGQRNELAVIFRLVRIHRIVGTVRPAAAQMREKMPDGDVLDRAPRGNAELRPQDAARAEHLVLEPQPALLDQREYPDRCDRLAETGDAKQMRRGDLFSGAGVGDAEALRVDRLPMPRDRDGHPGHVVGFQESIGDRGEAGAFAGVQYP